MTEPETGPAGGDAKVPRPRSSVSAVAFALLAPFVAAAYLSSASAMDAFFCPVDTWKFGRLGSFGSLQVGVFAIFLMVGILVIRTSTRIAQRRLSPVLSFLRTVAKNDYYCVTMLMYGLLVIVLIWSNYVESYYCAGPTGLVIRTGLIRPATAAGWNHVRTALANCAITKSGLTGMLTLTLDDGAVIPMWLKTGTSPSQPGDYAPIRTALAGQPYLFGLTPSVTQNGCPPELYVAFTNWQK